jgi:diguanylate cyclase (GGDEF)-like protein
VVAAIVAVTIHEVLEGGDDPLSLAFGVACVLLAALRLNMLERTQERLASELVEIAHRMETEANKDALTGLGNRAGLGIHLDNALNRQSQSGVSVFYIDIDHFKSVNDGLGHEAGDQLLVEIADRLSNVLGDDVFRIGGDEFLVVLERGHGERDITDLCDQLLTAIASPYEIDGRRVTHFPSHVDDLRNARPVYETLPGWSDTTVGITDYGRLPVAARHYLERIEQITGVPIHMVSTSPDRDHTILMRNPFLAP